MTESSSRSVASSESAIEPAIGSAAGNDGGSERLLLGRKLSSSLTYDSASDLVRGQVVRDARLRVVRPAAAEVLHLDVLAGHGLDHVRAGDEHVAGLVHHHREVGDRGGVDGPARARAHDQRDLRDDPRAAHVAHEDLAVEAERDDALLDARAATVVDADHRDARLEGEVHGLDDLLAVHLAERAAEDRRVLAEHRDVAAVDRAGAGDHAVAVGTLLLHAEVDRAVPDQLVELDERARVEQCLDTFAGGLAALGALALDGSRACPCVTASSMRR